MFRIMVLIAGLVLCILGVSQASAKVAAPAPVVEEVAAAPVAAAPVAAPIEVGNKICPVSGEKIGEMGKRITQVYNGKAYGLCCPMCVKDFTKDPEKYSAIADKEVSETK